MDYIGTLIKRVRRDSQSLVYSAQTGVQDQSIVDFLNEGVTFLTSKISAQNSVFFQREVVLSASPAGTYTIRGRLSYDSKIIAVQQVIDDNSRPVNLTYRDIRELGIAGSSYSIQNGEIVIDFNGSQQPFDIKVIYEEQLPRFAVRAGIATAGTGLNGQLTDLAVNYLNNFSDDDFNLAGDMYICAFDKDGNITMRNIPYNSVALGDFELDPYSYEIGESIDIGSYIALGKNVSTHVGLSREHQDFLVGYATHAVMGIKGCSFETQTFLRKRYETLLEAILETHTQPVKDYSQINVVDRDLLIPWRA